MLTYSKFVQLLKEPKSALTREQRTSWVWTVYFCCVLALTGAFVLFSMRQITGAPVLGWLAFLGGVIAIVYQPRFGVYLMLFYALAGDSVVLDWYPFMKGLSSTESVLFLHSALIVNPLEIYILVTFASWLGRGVANKKLALFKGELSGAVLLFLAFALYGLGYGLVTGGSASVALWEIRPLIHMVALFFLTTNLIEKRGQVINLMLAAMFGILILGLSSDIYFLFMQGGDLTGVDSLTEHGSAIQMNTYFVLGAAAWLYKAAPRLKWGILLTSPLVLISYFAAQRRAGFLALGVAAIVFLFYIYKDFRRVFWMLVPVAVIAGIFYVVIFWNSGSSLAFPLQAVKSVIDPAAADPRDQSSNYYRILENINSSFTVHQAPITGIGFGKKFYILVPLPDISFFIWWEYITHNSIIWIWMKMGAGGFIAMMFMVGLSLAKGIRLTSRIPRGNFRAIALTATLYLLMHFSYGYLDMSWDSRSMVYIGAMMGLVNCLEHILEQPGEPKTKRFPWQRQPEPDFVLPSAS